MGDFNYKDINWQTHQASEPIAQKFLDCLEDSFLTQHVTQPTRDNSVLDLVITDKPGMIDHVGVYGHFSTSDHNILYWTTNVVGYRPAIPGVRHSGDQGWVRVTVKPSGPPEWRTGIMS